jgi:F-box/leucine-rich repeat protein 14
VFFSHVRIDLSIGYADTTTNDFEPITALRNLRILDLHYADKIFVDALAYITCLNQLQTLNLSYCRQLKGNIARYLKDLTNLRQLMIASISLSERDIIDTVTTMKFLTSFQLPELTQYPHVLPFLTCMTSLCNLIIPRSDPQRMAKPIDTLWTLSTVTSLSFGILSPIPKSALETIRNMTNLQTLELVNFCYSDLSYLSTLQQLTELLILKIELCNNGNMSNFLMFTSLQILRIFEAMGLSEKGIITLTSLTRLQVLYLNVPTKTRGVNFKKLRTLFSPYALIYLPGYNI